MTTVVVNWLLSRNYWNPELPIFNQLDEQESKQKRELRIITLMDRPYGDYSSSTLPWGWDQPFNTFSTFTGHLYSSIANYALQYGDDPDWPLPPRHTQNENCPLQPCCHLQHCILRPTTLVNQHGDDCCCTDCLVSSITLQPIASTQCDSAQDQTIVCRTHTHLQTDGPEFCTLHPTTLANPHGDNCCCANCLVNSITLQPIASTQCDSILDQSIEFRTHIHLQAGGPESNPYSVNMGVVGLTCDLLSHAKIRRMPFFKLCDRNYVLYTSTLPQMW